MNFTSYRDPIDTTPENYPITIYISIMIKMTLWQVVRSLFDFNKLELDRNIPEPSGLIVFTLYIW